MPKQLLDTERILEETGLDQSVLDTIPFTKIVQSPHFANIYNKFQELYKKDPVHFTFKAVFDYAVTLEPKFTYKQIADTFRPLVNNDQAKVRFTREAILAKMVRVGNDALTQIIDDPESVDVKTRVNFGAQAVAMLQKEVELEMKDRQHNEKLDMAQEMMSRYQYGFLGEGDAKNIIDEPNTKESSE